MTIGKSYWKRHSISFYRLLGAFLFLTTNIFFVTLAKANQSVHVVNEDSADDSDGSTPDEGQITIYKQFMPVVGTSKANELMFYDGFENGLIPYGERGANWKPVNVNLAQVVSSPARAGGKAVQFTTSYNSSSANAPGVELRLNSPDEVNHFDLHKGYWYGFSIYLPNNFKVNDQTEILQQFFAPPDESIGESWVRNPPFSLRTNGTRWAVTVRADSDRLTKKNDYDVDKTWDLGPWEDGKWTDWVYYIKWSYEDDGIIRIWRDGQLVLDYQGPNTYNDEMGPYWKMGIYEWYWRTGPTAVTSRTVYFDELRIGDDTANYGAVAP